MKKSALSVGKRLQVSLLLPLAILGLGCNKANAEDIYAPVPTLTKLHEEGATIPDTNPPIVYPKSSYSITSGDENNYNFTTQSYDSSGNLTNHYYKTNIEAETLNSDNITWQEVSAAGENTVQVNLPNSEVKYFQYTINDDATLLPRNNNQLLEIPINGGVLKDYSSAIWNNKDASSITIVADFINNQSSRGGAIFNANKMGNIIGNFINNSSKNTSVASVGGAIYNESNAVINNIDANFINNSIIAGSEFGAGSAIYNSGTIHNISGLFLSNTASYQNIGISTLANAAVIDNIAADFISNNNAIVNSGTIKSITGDFIDNNASEGPNMTTYSGASGGAIYNTGSINTIHGNFIGNYADLHNTLQSTSGGKGGAIYNKGTINNIINSNFYNNYAIGGGAIYTEKDLNIVADNGTSTFKGNYVGSNKISNAIYVTSSGANTSTLTFNAINNGEIFLYDDIDGLYHSYTTKFTGDGSGTVHLFNNIKDGNVVTENIIISTINNNVRDYNFYNLKSGNQTKYAIDVDLTYTPTSDKFIPSDMSVSSGKITISDINYIGDIKDYSVQVLKAPNDNIQLAIADDIDKTAEQTINGSDTVTPNVKWNQEFNNYKQTNIVNTEFTLSKTNTTNDTLNMTITGIHTEGEKIPTGTLGDTLALVNQLETTEDRSFTFDTANDKYNVSSDLGKTTAGKLSINGVSDTTKGTANRSEINLNGHKGFELDNETTLNVNNTRLTGNDTLITVNNQNSVVNLKNANLNGSIAAENSYKLNITGDTSDRTIINGGVGKANATHSGGELGFNTDTFKDAEFSTTAGKVDLVTGQVENYDIGKLTSDESANWIFEVDSSGSGADTLTVGTGSSGTVNVSEINFINGDSPSDEFTVQVLNAQDDNIQLVVDSSIAGENHKLGTVTRTSEDTVTPTAKWNQTFNKYTQNGTNYGNIDVATTNTTNDSLQLKVTSTEWDEKTVSGSMGDTLALVNQLETEENRNFNFDTANDVYNVTSDLGTSSTGTMNVNGVKSGETRSTINGNNYNMFALSNPTTLNLNNVKIQGANSVVSGTNKNAVINMNNAELKNNASGITTAGSVNISGKSVFANNGNGIEVTDENSIITLNGLDGEGYDVTFKDKLKGVSGAKLNLKAGQVEFHKSVTDLDINMEGTTANLASDNVFNGQNLTVASASNVSMINNSVGTMQLNSLTLNDNMNLGVDVDLANKSMDRISANTYNLGEHKVNVNKMNLLSDAKEVRTDIEFADEGLRNNVTTSVSEVAYSPIYKYGVKYDPNNGEFQFTRSNSGGDDPHPQPTYDDLNPAIMASPVAAQLGGYAGMLDNYGNAFNHMDMYMLKPKNLRAAELNANKYAIADGRGGTYISNETNTNGIWVRPYTSYDSVGLKHGPKVHNLSYGSFIGCDFGMHNFGNGLYGEFSPYISYQGAHQHYSGNSIYQNGGTLGFTGTLYKGNFFTGLTAGVGANVTEARTMYGNEDFPMLTTGVASKTGYNIEFKDGKFIIQPSLLVSYTFVNTFDYKNGAGVRIDTAPLHAVQISPNIRFSFNTKNHWQPYAFVGMNWNIMDSGHFKAADTTLPELSMKPYVHYGLGIQKLFSDNFTAFAQVAIRNGGRNGVGGTLGMKWILGGQPKKQEEQKPKDVL